MRQVSRSQVTAMHWPVLEPLEVEEGEPRPVALSKPVCVAGARSKVNLPLPSPLVSRAHALFVADDHGVYVRDLASRNHVYLNETPVRESVLADGDVVRIGPFSFRCAKGFAHEDGADGHAPAARLQSLEGEKSFALEGRSAVIGSRHDCDIPVPEAAPVHAVIFQRNGRWFIRDLRSPTGTVVNENLVGQIELQPGDAIRIGDSHFRYDQLPTEGAEAALPVAPAAEPQEKVEHSGELAPAAEVQPPAETAPPESDKAESVRETVPAASAPEPAKPPEPQAAHDEFDLTPLLEEPAVATPALPPGVPPPEPPGEPNNTEPIHTAQQATHEDFFEPDEVIPFRDDPRQETSGAPRSRPAEPPEPSTTAGATDHRDEMSPPHPGQLAEAAVSPTSEAAASPDQIGDSGRPERDVVEQFSGLLEELSENVEQIQTVWQELKTNPDASMATQNPGASTPTDQKTSAEIPSRSAPTPTA